MKKGLCFQCLFSGAKRSDSKHKDGKCQRDFVCHHPSHDTSHMEKHVVVCSEHKDTQLNQDLFNLYKSKCILRQTSVNLPKHSMEMQLSFHVDVNCSKGEKLCSGEDNAIYQLETIEVNGKMFSFPTYPLQGKVMEDIVSAYQQSGGNLKDLPKITQTVEVTQIFLIGIKYLQYYPQMIF